MNGTPVDGPSSFGKGISRGKWGFEVADVGRGGRDKRSGVRPGIRRATTF